MIKPKQIPRVSRREDFYTPKSRVYLLVPEKESILLSDAAIMMKIKEIHGGNPVNHVYFPENSDFQLSKRYCIENKRGRIDFDDISTRASQTERILDSYTPKEYKSIVLVSRERSETLEQTANRLAKVGFTVEITELI